jgi:hypothetical protein
VEKVTTNLEFIFMCGGVSVPEDKKMIVLPAADKRAFQRI